MSVYKDKQRGTWYFVVRKKNMNGEVKQIKRRSFRTKKEAQEAEAKIMLLQQDNLSRTTFREVSEHFLDEIRHTIKETTYDKYKDDIDNHILTYFDKYPIAKITAKDISDWKKHQLTKKLSKHSYDRHFARLSSIFKHGMKYFDITINPCAVAGGFKLKTETKKMEFFTPEEFDEFISIVDDQKYRILFYTLFYTGMRRGEILALQWKDIEDNVIHITKAVYYPKTGAKIGSPKTASSTRDIVIPVFLVNMLEEYKKSLSEQIAGFNDAFYIFGGISFLARTTLNKRFNSYIKDERINVKKIRMHDLRHSHASYLINVFNANPVLVAERLGHKDVAETLNTYSHLYPSEQNELAQKIDAQFSNVTKMLPK